MYIYGNINNIYIYTIITFFKGLMHFQDRIQQSRHRGKFDDVLGGWGKGHHFGDKIPTGHPPPPEGAVVENFEKMCHSKLTT